MATQNHSNSLSHSAQESLGVQSSDQQLAIPLHLVLRHLALKPTHGEALFPSSWTALQLQSPIEIDTTQTPATSQASELQYKAYAVFDHKQKKWSLKGTGNNFDYKTLGIVASKQHGARAIQLPNRTHKIVAGVVDGNDLLNLFAAPSIQNNGSQIIINPISKHDTNFLSIVPSQARVKSATGDVKIEKISEQTQNHFQYVLHSKKVETGEVNSPQKVERSKLNWSEEHIGSDVADLSRLKDYLTSLRNTFESDPQLNSLSGTQKRNFEERLILLEGQIEGILKKKIQFTSVDSSGTRFLDYTTILNEKENQLIGLNKKIENLQKKLEGDKKSESNLKKEIQRLSEALKTLQNPNVTQEQISDLLLQNSEAVMLNKQAANYKKKMDTTSQVLKSHMKDLKLKGVKVENENELSRIVEEDQTMDINLSEGLVHIVESKDRIIQKPMQDEKTQELIRRLGAEINRIYTKYPKVKSEANPQFIELLNRDILKTVDNDGLDKIIEIVKFVPSLVKVENTYTYNSDKQKRVEFHQRILLKSLFQEFQKMKVKTGYTPEIDESVITMINEEISDTVEVDDILKCFQVNHKIVEVPKIVEKIVQRVVQIPTIIPVERYVEKVVYNTKIQEVEKIIHVPIEVIKYVDRIVEKIVEVEKIREKLVEVPKIVEKIVERRVEVPKIVEVEVIIEKIVEVEKPVIVQRIVNQPVPEIRQIEVIKQETVVVKEVEERIKEVERIVERIVERVVEKPVIIEVEKIVEKIVNTIQYKAAKQTVNHIERVPQIIERIVQKIVPIIQTVEKIKEVTKIVQKIVEVIREVPTVKEIKVIEERIVYQDRIKEVEKIVEKVVPLCQEVQKIVERRVEVPIIQEKIVVVQEIVEKVVPQIIQIEKIVEVEKIVEKIVEVSKIVEVPKPIIKYVREEIPVKVVVQKIVEIPRIVERIKEVRVNIDKIIEKMVEVPKVVEVEKIVEKIVVVPRIIEKIVTVPQIVEKIVDRIVEVEKVVEVIKEVKVPIITEKIVEVEVIKNVLVPEIKTVEVIRQKIVPVKETKEIIKEVEVIKEKIVEKRVEIAKQIYIDNVVSHQVEVEKIVEVEKAMVIPFQVPVPCEKIVEKLVIVEKEVEKIKEVPKETEKIVEVIKEVATVKEIPRIEEKVVIHEQIKEVEKLVPLISEKIKEVEVCRQKPVPVTTVEERIVEVPVHHQKIVTVEHEVPKIYEVEKVVEKIVEVPRFVEITAKEPVIITQNKIVDRFIDKVVNTTCYEEKIKEVQTIKEKIVTIEKLVHQIKEVEVFKDKIIEKEKLITKTDVNNKIETKYEPVITREDKLVTVAHSTQKIVEVPHIMEKVVERIIMMPQIHEVSKHIIDIQQEAHPGVAVDVDFAEHETKYKGLYSGLKKDMDSLVVDLKSMQKSHPELQSKLKSVESYMSNLDEVIAHPRIVQVNNEKIVTKEVPAPVILQSRGSGSSRDETFYLVLIEKIERQLKNAQKKSNYAIEDEDLKRIFFSGSTRDEDARIKAKIDQYQKSQEGGKLLGRGDSLLISNILYDKYQSLSQAEKASSESNRYRKLAEDRLELLHQFKQTNDMLHQRLVDLEERVRLLMRSQGNNRETSEELKKLLKEIQDLDELLYKDIKKTRISEPLQTISKIHGDDVSTKLLQTKVRELQAQVETLKKELILRQGKIESVTLVSDKQRVIQNLQKQISKLVHAKGETMTTLEDLDRSKLSPRKPADKNQSIIYKSEKNIDKKEVPAQDHKISEEHISKQAITSIGKALLPPKGGTYTLSVCHKPGFYGQLFVPVFTPDAFDSYYATPASAHQPAMMSQVVQNKGDFYPNPVNPTASLKKKIFDNGQVISSQYLTDFSWQAVPYLDAELAAASISPSYSFSKFKGYLSVPIGTADFMGKTDINGQACYCPNKLYAGGKMNDWTEKVFVDPTKVSRATILFNSNPTNSSIYGHLVIPVPKPSTATSLYSSMDASMKVAPPAVPYQNQLDHQVVYVPKGTPYDIFDLSVKAVDHAEGFIVLPVSFESWLDQKYSTSSIDINNYQTYIIVDELGNNYQVSSFDAFSKWLGVVKGSRETYWWNPNTWMVFNDNTTIVYYSANFNPMANNSLIMPVGKYQATTQIGSQNNAAKNAVHEGPSRSGDTPWDPYAPPPPGSDAGKYEVKKPGDTPWDPYAPPPPGTDASKYEVKKPGDTPWDPYAPPPPGTDASKYEMKKPGDTPWDPYAPPPPGTDASKYEVKKPGDTPWDPWVPPPPGTDAGKYEVKKPGDTPWDPYAPPPPGSSQISGAHWLPSAINHLQNNSEHQSLSPSPRRYKIVEEIPVETPRNPQGYQSSQIYFQQPTYSTSRIQLAPAQQVYSVIQPGSYILDSSQVRPVNTLTGSNIPINPTLIPYPPQNPLYPGNILNLPGTVETTRTTDEHGNVIETTKQRGSFVGPNNDGANYESTYLYKSQVKEEGEGNHKVTKQITEIRTNQTVNWISKSRVLEDPKAYEAITPEKKKEEQSKVEEKKQ